MNKHDLSKKWSKYCDTDKLVDDVIALLKKYKHPCTEHGVCTLLNKYFENKEPLIKLFTNSNNYIGDMRISCMKEFDRKISQNEIRSFFCSFIEKAKVNQILKFEDGDGRTFIDYLSTGRSSFDIDSLPSKKDQTAKKKKLSQFNYADMATIETSNAYNDFNRHLLYFNGVYSSTLQNDYVYAEVGGKKKVLKKGTKTSRAFNTVCKYYGVDKLCPEVISTQSNGQPVERTIYPYDKVFAQYADLVSDLKRKMRFIISLNPLDYLTMSFGVSWVSCHNIANGGWKGGCLSYMLDGTSMITFVVDNTDDPIHEIPKLYRQMYHYENSLFVQNRLYPQGNDGATNLYDKFRNFVIEEFTEILQVDGKWECEVGRNATTNHIYSIGKHYKDYNSNSSCSIFYPYKDRSKARGHVMTIGHEGICVRCGAEFSYNAYLAHYSASDCSRF